MSRVLIMGATAHVEVLGTADAYYVRVDTGGGGSCAPLKGWAAARIAAIDRDGSVLLVGTKGPDDGEERLLVVDPDRDEAAELASAPGVGGARFREGIPDLNALEAVGGYGKLRLPASRQGADADRHDTPEKLWDKALIGGAAWETDGGASVTQTVDPIALSSGGGQQP